MRAGSISAETAFVLDYFKADTPALLKDVGTQIKDIHIRRTEGVSSNLSMKKAWEMMKILNVVTLPVVNKKDKLEGLIVTGDIAKSYMDVYDNSILAKAEDPVQEYCRDAGWQDSCRQRAWLFCKRKGYSWSRYT